MLKVRIEGVSVEEGKAMDLIVRYTDPEDKEYAKGIYSDFIKNLDKGIRYISLIEGEDEPR